MSGAVDHALVVVGVVGKPFGVDGGCYVRPVPDVPHDFAAGQVYDTPHGDLRIKRTHEHGRRRVVAFFGVESRADAESLRGTVLKVAESAVTLDQDMLWSHQVIGAQVLDTRGAVVGTVTGVADGPAHDYLLVQGAEANTPVVWVPAVSELIEIRRGDNVIRVIVQALPGLFDP